MDYASSNNKSSKINCNPREVASIFSLITFFYNFSILKKGRKKDIEENDIFDVIPEYESEKLGDKLEMYWKKAKKSSPKPSIIKCLLKLFGNTYLLITVSQFIFSSITILLSPNLLSKFVLYFEPGANNVTRKDAYYYAAALIGLNFLSIFYTNNIYQLTNELSLKIKTALSSVIYRKVLKINSTALAECSTGKTVTLLTKDVSTVESCLIFLKDVIISFIQLATVAYILYQKVGLSAFPAIGFVILVIPVQMFLGKYVRQTRLKAAKKSDMRFKLLQEALSAIKIIKMYTWQNFFEKMIHSARIKETNEIKKVYYLKLLIAVLGSTTINLAFYILLISYIARGYNIEAETVYYVQTCLSAIKHSIRLIVPLGITQTADMLASFQRIQSFLESEEVIPVKTSREPPVICLNEINVKIYQTEILKSVSVRIDKSGLLLITGNVGSGKSAILKTILGEYPIVSGERIVHGNFSYASEEPWLFPSTIRQNILFGQSYNEKRYQEVLNVCSLTYDINKFEKLDQSIVGDKGFNLSKGQQARIALARAIYKESDIYLLDDCLSALDNQVNKEIFHNCIKGFLKNKICLFVTNNINHIKSAGNDHILFIENGTTLTLEQQQNALDKRITYYMDEENDSNWKRFSRLNRVPEIEDVPETFNETDALLLESKKCLDDLIQDNTKFVNNLYHEEKKIGKVESETYLQYIKYMGGIFVIIFLLVAFLIAQFCLSYSEKLISKWVNVESNISTLVKLNRTNSTDYFIALEKRDYFFKFYSILIFTAIFLVLGRSFSTFFYCMNAAKKLHEALLKTMLEARMYFFDNHFIGNIINRLSKDFNVIDEEMPYKFLDCFITIFNISGVITLIISVDKLFLVPIFLIFITMYIARRYYMPTGRSLRRLESATKSPVIGYLNTTLEGLPVIRAAQQQNKLQHEFDKHQDLFTSTYFMNLTTLRFFTFTLESFGTIFLSVVILKFLLFPGNAVAGDVGLALTQATMVSMLIQFALRQITELENSMTSVERALEYVEVETESNTGQVLIENWPVKGAIQYKNVSLSYKSDEHIVLNNINIMISGQEKIGIVGRTGAGKSSIISTLFRLYDYDGDILIDGENTRNLSLNYLREKIGIIPQDPILFSGTIRTNIDPFGKYSDAEIWNALNVVHMKCYITNLTQEITDINSAFSSGQKQLICLARALIQNNKIIVLDEATANLDPETEQLLQKTVVESFQTCTVLIIAHKLHSIMHCDKILVLDAGKIVEFDTPEVLMKNSNGFLSQMVKEENYTA